MMFDTFVMVDWSAASVPRTGRDSIWICWLGPDGERLENPPTRRDAAELLADRLAAAVAVRQRVLLGFDFPFGYPAGFAGRLGLCDRPWRAVWDEIARLIEDDEHNRNNRFAVAAAFNERVSGGMFPFWGRPARLENAFLGARHHKRHDADGLRERRLVDTWMVGAQPCWKLLGAGSVGGQVLTGIPVVRRLRDDPRWADRARVWPCETGLGIGDEARVVFAEIWPSWWRARSELGPPNDRAQVRTVAAILAACDRSGKLASWFAPPVGAADARRVIDEEAWTLGVTAPRGATRLSKSPRVVAAKEPAIQSGVALNSSPRRKRGPRTSDRNPSVPACARTTEKELEGRKPQFRCTLFRRGDGKKTTRLVYLRDPDAIARRSRALIRAEADLTRLPRSLRWLALRLVQAAGDASVLEHLAWSRGAIAAGMRAMLAGAPILVDSTMVAAGIGRERLPAANTVLCTLNEPAVARLAKAGGTTRSAAAVELWRPYLSGALVAVGNAPTALFRLLEMIDAEGRKPALVFGFPVGFVGAAEAKQALAGFGRGLAFVTLHGRRGGSPLAAAAVNALASLR
jgi:precorrin-8X/cobalt-precorrin-8 methylmutase